MENMANLNNNNQNRDSAISFRVIEQLGVLERHKSGWNREVNIVSWNGHPPKFDIRDWDPDHERMSRGITLYEREAIKLTQILARRLDLNVGEDEVAGGEAF